jgi:pyruvate dehydrogenase E2 component (dihydrolipoamide acetyltransferase)
MRRTRPAAPLIAALVLAMAVLPGLAAPAAAKEGMSAVLDAPIGLDTPPGTVLLVGVTVNVLDETGTLQPVVGSPIVLILTGRGGAVTEDGGATPDAARPNHYEMRIAIPDGGVRDVKVVIRGSNGTGPVDLDIPLTEDPFTFGGVSARSAQVAPAPTPALTPFPRASAAAAVAASAAPVVAPAAAAPAPEAAAPAPAAPSSGQDGITWWPGALVLVLLGLAVVIAVRLRAGRTSAPGA